MKPILSLALLLVSGCADRSWHVNTNAAYSSQYMYGSEGGCNIYLFPDGTWDAVVAVSNKGISQQFKTQLEAMHWVERMCPE